MLLLCLAELSLYHICVLLACSECVMLQVGLVCSEGSLKRIYVTLHLVQVQTSQCVIICDNAVGIAWQRTEFGTGRY